MTRLRLTDLPTRMRQQALKQIAEQERNKAQSNKKLNTASTKHFDNPYTPQAQDSGNGNKYNAHKVTVILPDGKEHKFDSAKEARVYNDLLLRQKAGEIQDLRLQVPYELIPKQILSTGKTERKVAYIADFVYTENGETKVVDVKGYRKGQAYAVFVIKRKLMKFIHNIEVTEI